MDPFNLRTCPYDVRPWSRTGREFGPTLIGSPGPGGAPFFSWGAERVARRAARSRVSRFPRAGVWARAVPCCCGRYIGYERLPIPETCGVRWVVVSSGSHALDEGLAVGGVVCVGEPAHGLFDVRVVVGDPAQDRHRLALPAERPAGVPHQVVAVTDGVDRPGVAARGAAERAEHVQPRVLLGRQPRPPHPLIAAFGGQRHGERHGRRA